MTGPHPVVGLTTELTGRCGRSTNKTDIAVNLIDNDITLIVVVETRSLDFAVGILFLDVIDHVLNFAGLCAGNIDHALKECNCKARNRYLLLLAHCPETVLQIVVFRS